MILVLVIRKAFGIKEHKFKDEESSDAEFTKKRSLAFIDFPEESFKVNETDTDGKTLSYIFKENIFYFNKYNDDNLWEGQNTALNKIFDICVNKAGKERYKIALVNVPNEIKNKLIEIGKYSDLNFKMSEENSFLNFDSVDKMKNYVEQNSYGSENVAKLCLVLVFKK